MFSSNITLADPITKGMACAAIHPGLQSILVFDASYADLKAAAAVLVEMLKCATGKAVKSANLGVSELDDDLWGSLALSNSNGDSPLVWHHGPLAELWTDSDLKLVIIPDLTRLSLAAARACVMLIGADVAHLERHRQHEMWRPNICWLTGCRRKEIGSVSPHLLDRFALRLSWQRVEYSDRIANLLQTIRDDKLAEDTPEVSIPSMLKEQIQWAARHWAKPTETAIDTLLDYSSRTKKYLPRREIALARLAVTIALIEGGSLVTASHVEDAVALIGLSDTEEANDIQQSQEDLPPGVESPTSELQSPNVHPSVENSEQSSRQLDVVDNQEEYAPNEDRVLEAIPLPVDPLIGPYPEDSAPIEREFASLRLPLSRYTAASSGRGTIVGIEQATNVHDLSLVGTVFAAALFQPIRRKYQPADNHRFLLLPTDLRSYRRSPAAEQMLMLLLDYTSLHECDWQQALQAYLSWAYIERASICIVQVGIEGAAHPLRAEVVNARSILVPTVDAALEAKQGKATPLAHGLDIAYHTLLHALEHGRSTIKRAVFVVISDGRGNVPLEASQMGYIAIMVNREGIEDALQIAQRIRELREVQAVLLNPQPQHYPDLPLTLAKALGAGVVNIQHLEVGEV